MITQDPKGTNNVVAHLWRVRLLIDAWTFKEFVNELNSLDVAVVSGEFVFLKDCH